ncbi:MAG: hotdog fold thioesterase [Saprospiraceae bacterium]|nr:hotdog fold thioesterase [Saprospiraceae bacterium]MDZ4704018.1 hotdog fold thioesterase [Saprospiraceae bacterium]
MLWKQSHDPAVLQEFSRNTLVDALGIEFLEVGDDFITARMPVDHRTVQPMRILHGGASVALAETLGSVASVLCLDDPASHAPVGVEINANHLSQAKEGTFVYGTVKALKVGRRMHVWNIKIKDENGKLICVSRLTIAVIERR